MLFGTVWTPDGSKVPEILALLPKARAGENVKLKVAEESGVTIHSVELAKDHLYWNDFIGATTLYVGAGKEAVWVSAGEEALDNLKAAIKKAAQPASAGADKAPWAELLVHVKPFVDEANTQPAKRKGDDKYRKMLLSSFEGGDDQLSVRMTRRSTRSWARSPCRKGSSASPAKPRPTSPAKTSTRLRKRAQSKPARAARNSWLT